MSERHAGQHECLAWVDERSPADLGASLTGNGIPVAEVRPQSRAKQAVTGKSDVIDAEAAARSVLGQDESRIATPRATGDRSALRVLLAARKLMDQQRTAGRNALTALLRTIDLGVDARRPVTDAQIASIAAWRTDAAADTATTIARGSHAPSSDTPGCWTTTTLSSAGSRNTRPLDYKQFLESAP